MCSESDNFTPSEGWPELKPVGMVLEGGGLRGIFTAGILDYFMEHDLYPSYVVGCSAGACNLLGYLSRQIRHTKDCMIQKDKDSSYYGVNQLIQNRKIIDLDKIFYEYPYHQSPFDFETFFHSPVQHEMVVTNCQTGKAEYLSEKQDQKRLSVIGKASSSMPLFTQEVFFDGNKYMDGGVSDSIPIQRSISRGYAKNIVILTRQWGHYPQMTTYQKLLYDVVYRNQPKLLEVLKNRQKMYLEETRFLSKEQAEGRAFVLRPEVPEIRRLESNYDILLGYYQHGYDIADKYWKDLNEFLSH